MNDFYIIIMENVNFSINSLEAQEALSTKGKNLGLENNQLKQLMEFEFNTRSGSSFKNSLYYSKVVVL